MREGVHQTPHEQGLEAKITHERSPQSSSEQGLKGLMPLWGSWRRERLGVILVVALIYGLYYPFTHWAIEMSPYDMSTALDRALPLWTSWIVIYAMIYPTAVTPAFVVRHPILFRRAAFAFLVSAPIGLGCFLLFPVHMHLRPALESLPAEGFLTWGLRLCYSIDKPSGCFPSLHVTYATLAALTCARANRRAGVVMWAVAIAINLSTLLVKQHFIADVVGGVALAYGSDWVSHNTSWSALAARDQLITEEEARAEGLTPLIPPLIAFLTLIATLFGLYLWGVTA